MRLGVGLFGTQPVMELKKLAGLADRLGYTHAWFADSQCLWRDPYVTMAAAAAETEQLILGTGVSNTITRELTALASAWLALHELTGGRVAIGLGAGDSAVRMIGKRPLRLAEFESDVTNLRSLTRGETITGADGSQVRMDFDVPADIPMYLAASGPKLLHMAGRIADGVILLVGADPVLIRAGLSNIEAGAHAAGRSLSDIDVVLWAPTSISDDGEQARQLVKSHVARAAIHPLPAELDAETMSAIERLRSAYDHRRHMDASADHVKLVPDSLVEHFAIAGTPSECARQVEQIAATGVNEISIVPFVPPGAGRDSLIRTAHDVIGTVSSVGAEAGGS